MPANPSPPQLLHMAYWLIGTVAVCLMLGKIVGAENVYEPSRYAPAHAKSYGAGDPNSPTRVWPGQRPEPTPFFSSNDRSRWATVRALVDEGAYRIGQRVNFTATEPPFQDEGIIFEDDYKSLDKVMDPATGAFYSSKPPLLATVLAGEYWLLKNILGWDIVRDRWVVVCTILITVNVLPFVAYLLLLAKLLQHTCRTDVGRLLAFITAALCTFLTTFCHTLNNHTPAAYCVLFALYPLLRQGLGTAPETRGDLAISGFFLGVLVALELPALSLAVAIIIPLLYLRPLRTLCWMLPLFVVPLLAQVLCNYSALGTWVPAYSSFGGPWYNYPGSHWAKWELVQQGQFVPGIDFNQEPIRVYALHVLIGHHGWFSLMPVFVLSLGAMLYQVSRCGSELLTRLGRAIEPTERVLPPNLLGLVTLLVTVVVVGFYFTRTQSYNYGGNTSGLRWLFWLIPLWLLPLGIAGDWLLQRRTGLVVVILCVGLTVLAVYYPAWNPWRSPWLLQAFEQLGWVNYDKPPAR